MGRWLSPSIRKRDRYHFTDSSKMIVKKIHCKYHSRNRLIYSRRFHPKKKQAIKESSETSTNSTKLSISNISKWNQTQYLYGIIKFKKCIPFSSNVLRAQIIPKICFNKLQQFIYMLNDHGPAITSFIKLTHVPFSHQQTMMHSSLVYVRR